MTVCLVHHCDAAAGLERLELREKLKRAGVADMLDVFGDADLYTQTGRLSIVKIARKLNRHHSYVRRALSKAREILEKAA